MFVPLISYGQCEKAASAYGNGEGPDHIPAECKGLTQKFASSNAKKVYPKSKVEVVGYKNLVYFNDFIFAGEYTMLRDVIAVAYNEQTAEIAALESNGDVLVFNAKIPGNVAPIRVIRHQEIDGASDVSFLSSKDEIAVHIPLRQEVLTFSRMANFFGREGKKNLRVRRQILNARAFPKQ